MLLCVVLNMCQGWHSTVSKVKRVTDVPGRTCEIIFRTCPKENGGNLLLHACPKDVIEHGINYFYTYSIYVWGTTTVQDCRLRGDSSRLAS